MKKMKRFLATLLAAVMALSAASAAFAAEGDGETTTEKGSITIKNPVEGKETYTIYRIFNLESYDPNNNAYLYKVNSVWSGFMDEAGVSALVAKDTETGYVYWKNWEKENRTDSPRTVTDLEGAKQATADGYKPTGAAELAKLAINYAKNNTITPVNTYAPNAASYTDITVEYDATETTKVKSIKFTGLDLGYYLVDSSMGALCALDTTSPDVTVKEKNTVPSVDKKVLETMPEGAAPTDGGEGSWGTENTAQIGDTVKFETTITVGEGAENYVLHDSMDEGFTFAADTGIESVKWSRTTGGTTTTQDISKVDGTTVTTGYELKTTALTDGCNFELDFSTYCANLAKDDKITVTYTAILNDKAVVSEQSTVVENDDKVNKNTTWLTYGDAVAANRTTDAVTKTRTWKIQLIKTDITAGADGAYPVLNGAEFSLYTDAACTDTNMVKLVQTSDGYRVATQAEIDDTNTTTTTTITAGTPIISGLDTMTYYLKETKAPAGYYLPPQAKEVGVTGTTLAGDTELVKADDGTTVTGYKPTKTDGVEKGGGVWITNSTTAELPSTGGMGTTIFYILGGLLVVAAAALLIVQRRRKKADK